MMVKIYSKNNIKNLITIERESYQDLLQMSLELDDKFDLKGNRLFYLAMSSNFFGIVTNYLKETGLTNVQGFKRIIIEKPFGDDLKSAEKLNNQIRKSFKEQEIFRIDHYLGKEMIQNIERLRFGNTIFEPLWNNKYIFNIQVTSSETLGIEDRGSYYESSGALKDMVHNHLLQMVSLLATETFVAGKIEIQNSRWAGVPFYIRTGKRMKKKSIQIVIKFKKSYAFIL